MKDLSKELRDQVEQLLEVRSKIGKLIDDAQYIELGKYLHALEVFARRPGQAFLPLNPTDDDFIQYRKIDELLRSQNIVVQPGLRYAQADIVLGLIKQSPRFRVLSDNDKYDIIKIYQDGVYGVMQEDIVLYETMQECKKHGMINSWDDEWTDYISLPILSYKAVFPQDKNNDKDKKIDMVIEDNDNSKFYIIEIKHSDKIDARQGKWLQDKGVLDRLSVAGREIACRSVMYRGETGWVEGIKYVNIEEYLHTLHYAGIKSV